MITQTNRLTDIVTYRVACTPLKTRKTVKRENCKFARWEIGDLFAEFLWARRHLLNPSDSCLPINALSLLSQNRNWYLSAVTTLWIWFCLLSGRVFCHLGFASISQSSQLFGSDSVFWVLEFSVTGVLHLWSISQPSQLFGSDSVFWVEEFSVTWVLLLSLSRHNSLDLLLSSEWKNFLLFGFPSISQPSQLFGFASFFWVLEFSVIWVLILSITLMVCWTFLSLGQWPAQSCYIVRYIRRYANNEFRGIMYATL